MNPSPSNQWLSRKSSRFRSRGFSLLEIIIAMSLGMVLLGAVWTMFNLLGRRQESELRQADRNQIIRSLHQRLTRDLKNLVALDDLLEQSLPDHSSDVALFRIGASEFQVPVPVPSASSPTQPTVVLSGSSAQLELEVFIEPLETIESGAVLDSDHTGKESVISEGPVTKQICYELGLADEAAAFAIDRASASTKSTSRRPSVDQEIAQGLVRRESIIDPREPLGAEVESDDRESWPDQLSNFFGKNFDQTAERTPVVSRVTVMRDHLPDIVAVRFAYFDGRSWLSRWNSRDQNRLPIAIRVQFCFLKPESGGRNERSRDSRNGEREELIPLEIDITTDDDDPALAYDAEFLLMVKLQPIDLGASLPLRTSGRPGSRSKEDQ